MFARRGGRLGAVDFAGRERLPGRYRVETLVPGRSRCLGRVPGVLVDGKEVRAVSSLNRRRLHLGPPAETKK